MSRSRPGCMNETSTGAPTGPNPTPAAGPTPAAIQSATPTATAVLSSEDPKMRRGGCNMRHTKYFEQNANFVCFASCRGADVSILYLRPLGLFDISTHDSEHLQERQPTRRSPEHLLQMQTTLGPHPRTSNAGWPEVAAGGVDSKTPPPTRISSRDANVRTIRRYSTSAVAPQGRRSSRYEQR